MQRLSLLAFLLAMTCAVIVGIVPDSLAAVPALVVAGAASLTLGATLAVVDALLRIAMAVRGVEFELRTANRTADQHAASTHRQERLQSETVDLCRQRLALARKATALTER